MNTFTLLNQAVNNLTTQANFLALAFAHDERYRDALLTVSERMPDRDSLSLAAQAIDRGLDPLQPYRNVIQPLSNEKESGIDASLLQAVEIRKVAGDIAKVVHELREVVVLVAHVADSLKPAPKAKKKGGAK